MSRDFYLSIFIILVFFLISIYGFLINQYELLKKQWPKYKCNPLIMPFASTFGKDPMENFIDCVQNIQLGFMDIALKPLNLNIDLLSNIGINIVANIAGIRQMFNFLKNSFLKITVALFGIFSNVITEFQKISLAIRDTVSKVVAIVIVLMNSLDGSVKTMKSLWKGPPGDLLRGVAGLGNEIRKLEIDPFCFHPDTLITLKDNNTVKIKDLKLNSILKNGSVVQGIIKLSNLDKNGVIKEKFYKLKGGENNQDIYVTGKHLIFIDGKLDYVKNHNNAFQTQEYSNELSCLITDNHLIPIGQHIFWDWEDSPDMTKQLN